MLCEVDHGKQYFNRPKKNSSRSSKFSFIMLVFYSVSLFDKGSFIVLKSSLALFSKQSTNCQLSCQVVVSTKIMTIKFLKFNC